MYINSTDRFHNEEFENEYKSVLAPVVLFVYNRLDHVKKTIESLKNNEYANDTELFIFSDGPKGDDDEYSVNDVRHFVLSLP